MAYSDYISHLYPTSLDFMKHPLQEEFSLDKFYRTMSQYQPFQLWDIFQDLDSAYGKNYLQHSLEDIDAIVWIGVGGSLHAYEILAEWNQHKHIEWFFLGDLFQQKKMQQLQERMQTKKNILFHVVSKSGKTIDILFILKQLEQELKKSNYVYVSSSEESFFQFFREKFNAQIHPIMIEPYIGGRFSVFSQLGSFALQLLGVWDQRAEWTSLLQTEWNAFQANPQKHPFFLRGIGHLILSKYFSYPLEYFAGFQENLFPLFYWLRQLWAESCGKAQKGMHPNILMYNLDAHSVNQILVEGPALISETLFWIGQRPQEKKHRIQLESATTQDLQEIYYRAIQKTHQDRLLLQEIAFPQWSIASLHLFFMQEIVAVLLESYFQETNPFNQNGVESYKTYLQEHIQL